MRNQCTRVLKMYPEQWERLEQLAKETNSRPRKGLDAHQVTWLAMIRRIADGELHVVDPKPYVMPPGLDEAAKAVEERQRQEQQRLAEQERQAEHRRRLEQHAEQKAAVRKTPAVKLAQLNMFAEPA